MKKTFRSILAGAVALLAVSCYDDSELRSRVGKLDERVTALETQLNAEVGGINDLATRLAEAEAALTTLNTTQIAGILTRLDAIDGAADGKIKNLEDAVAALKAADVEFNEDLAVAVAKIAVTGVSEDNGNVVLTLANGSTIALSKPLSNVDNTDLVTLVQTDEGKFWATVGADGTLTNLGVPVGHPDAKIEFQVSDTGELQYSVNDGEWTNTGVNTSDVSGQTYVVNNVETDEAKGTVSITIGEVVYELPLYAPAPSLKVKSGKTYFDRAESKEFALAFEGVSNLQVMNQPYGWKAKVKGSVLTVTAPSEANPDAEEDGVVVLHGEADGSCVTATLSVSLGAGLSISLDANGLVNIVNPIVELQGDDWFGYETVFMDAIIGLCPVEDFDSYSNFESFFTAAYNEEMYQYTWLSNFKVNAELGGEYIEGEYEVDDYSFSIATLGKAFYPSLEPVKGQGYVVWIVPQDNKGYYLEDHAFVYYERVEVEPKVEATWKSIDLTVDVYGADYFIAGAFPASEIGGENGFASFEEYMEKGYRNGGPWKQFQMYEEFGALGTVCENGATISVADLAYSPQLPPASEYYVWLMPIADTNKRPSEYDYQKDFAPYVFTFSTLPLEEGAEVAELAKDEEQTNYGSVYVNVDIPEEGETYYNFFNPSEIDGLSDMKIVAEILEYGDLLEQDGTVDTSDLTDGSTMLAVVTIHDGKYGLVVEKMDAKPIPMSTAIAVTGVKVVIGTDGKCTVEASVSGEATHVALYYDWSPLPTNFYPNVMVKNTLCEYAEVVDGKAIFEGLSGSSLDYKALMCSAYIADADGMPVALSEAISGDVLTFVAE